MILSRGTNKNITLNKEKYTVGTLSNKVILVTGGSSGIGRATSKILAQEGASVIVADILVEAGTETVKQIVDAGGTAIFAELDVTKMEHINRLEDIISEKFGRLDGAFNNAGIEGPTAKIDTYGDNNWENVISVNLTAVFSCIKSQLKFMSKQESGGSIVITSSVAGLVGLPGASGYNSAKHGVIGLTKTIALEYASKKIRVNSICPGFIDTPMLSRVTDASIKIREELIKMVPMRRVARAEEIGQAAAWLLSDKASYITGIALPVDGGWTAQ